MTKINLITHFINWVIKKNPSYQELDRIYLQNRLLALVGADDLGTVCAEAKDQPLALEQALVEFAVTQGQIDDNQASREILAMQVMDLLTPLPSAVNQAFWRRYQKGPKVATDAFYQASTENDYVKTAAIAKNIKFPVATDYGDLEITINLSKPEKDPKMIAAAAKAKTSGYPACQLCMENEGYQGRLNYPARANHRIVRFQLGQKTWGFQYSPYAYFNEHCIFLDSVHEPMKISKQTFTNLLAIIDLFPHYFVGSNADLPIVGGSMLSHEHYQGGRHLFAMAKAPIERTFAWPQYPDVQLGIVKWPMSVLRLTSQNKAALIKAATAILQQWQAYTDPSQNVLAVDAKGVQHHTVTPIARLLDSGAYQLDLVLRDNQTSATYPDGIFHPHQDVQHIKRENIGLIEVMGLAILPARLLTELKEVERYLLDEPNQIAEYHRPWADQIKQDHQADLSAQTVNTIVQQAVGQTFARVLEDAGVFKRTATGQAGFDRFVQQVISAKA